MTRISAPALFAAHFCLFKVSRQAAKNAKRR